MRDKSMILHCDSIARHINTETSPYSRCTLLKGLIDFAKNWILLRTLKLPGTSYGECDETQTSQDLECRPIVSGQSVATAASIKAATAHLTDRSQYKLKKTTTKTTSTDLTHSNTGSWHWHLPGIFAITFIPLSDRHAHGAGAVGALSVLAGQRRRCCADLSPAPCPIALVLRCRLRGYGRPRQRISRLGCLGANNQCCQPCVCLCPWDTAVTSSPPPISMKQI